MRLFAILFLLLATVNANKIPRASNIGAILHVTDIHYDIEYYPGSPDNCVIGTKTGMGCCRQYEIPLEPYHPCSKWGNFNCDNSILMVQKIFNWIRQNGPKLDYIFYTGDSPGHHLITQSVKRNLESINRIGQIIDYNFPSTPLFQALGNHDTYPIDQTPDFTYDTILNNVSTLWAKWLTNEGKRNARLGGYYSIDLAKNLKLIAFNSVFYDTNNIFRVKNDSDDRRTGFQFTWLENELQEARLSSQKIIMLNHISPGSGEADSYYTKRLVKLLANYQDLIVLPAYGHTHEDRFILFNNAGKFTGHTLVPGSLMTSNHDPDFRIYLYDRDTWDIIDYMQYSCSLQKTIINDRVMCNNTYNFTTEYNLPNIGLNSMVNIYNKLLRNDTDIVHKYIKHYWPGVNQSWCDKNCLYSYTSEMVVTV